MVHCREIQHVRSTMHNSTTNITISGPRSNKHEDMYITGHRVWKLQTKRNKVNINMTMGRLLGPLRPHYVMTSFLL